MFNKLAAIAVLVMSTMGLAYAQVDINRADQAALESVKGVGPAMSKSMLNERTKGGNFKDWNDLEKRVKGVGPASATRLSQAGLTVNGQTRPEKKTATAAKPTKSAALK